MNLDILREYSMLADLLNYGEAANELHISKSALSKHVASLEESVGTELFCRDGSFDLTPAGIAFLNETTSILSHYEHALQKCRAIGKKYPRSLRIEAVSFLYDTAIGVMQRSLRNAADANILQFTQLTDTPSQEMLVSHIRRSNWQARLETTTCASESYPKTRSSSSAAPATRSWQTTSYRFRI